ncbi:MAG: D-aminoacyl-tRNA deacylase [Candidatus Omnitrophota bacterium]
MKALIVRINKGSVIADSAPGASIGRGLAVFLGIVKSDTDHDAARLAEKIAHMRIFENESKKLDCSVKDKGYQVLCISNFTLCAKSNKGRRPSFEEAMPKEEARERFENFVLLLRGQGLSVSTGIYGAHMDIALDLDGPVNIVVE